MVEDFPPALFAVVFPILSAIVFYLYLVRDSRK